MKKKHTSDPFYRSKTWRKKRTYILQRDRYQCQCYKLFGGNQCGRVATEVHHIKTFKEHPELALNDDNLLSLAWICHEKTKERGKIMQGKGSSVNEDGIRIINM